MICLGNFCVDEKVLREEGVTDFSQYLAAPGQREEDLMPDFFLDEFLEIEQKNLGQYLILFSIARKVYFIFEDLYTKIILIIH